MQFSISIVINIFKGIYFLFSKYQDLDPRQPVSEPTDGSGRSLDICKFPKIHSRLKATGGNSAWNKRNTEFNPLIFPRCHFFSLQIKPLSTASFLQPLACQWITVWPNSFFLDWHRMQESRKQYLEYFWFCTLQHCWGTFSL